jgi:predicted small integral membrane protein
MEFVIIMILGILGAAFIVGGIVMYRRSESTNAKALSAAAVAAGVVMLAIILFTQVASVTSG